MLREFEEGGYVTSQAERRLRPQRKTYSLTEKGREAFGVAVEAWMEVTKALVETERVVRREDAAGCCG